MTNDFELHIIEMMKKEKEATAGNLKKWISFFNNPNGEAVREIAKEDEEIEKL